MSIDEKNAETASTPLHPSTQQRVRAVHLGLSLDGWAVVVAILLGVSVYFGVKVPW